MSESGRGLLREGIGLGRRWRGEEGEESECAAQFHFGNPDHFTILTTHGKVTVSNIF